MWALPGRLECYFSSMYCFVYLPHILFLGLANEISTMERLSFVPSTQVLCVSRPK